MLGLIGTLLQASWQPSWRFCKPLVQKAIDIKKEGLS